MEKIELRDFIGFVWGSMTFRVRDSKCGVVWIQTAHGKEEAWRFLTTSNTETFALLAVHTNRTRKELVMHSDGSLTPAGRQLLRVLMDDDMSKVQDLLQQAKGDGKDTCQRCGNRRVWHFLGKCDDRFSCSLDGLEHDGYPPEDVPLGSDSGYLQGSMCLDCGQVQGVFPVKETELERSAENG